MSGASYTLDKQTVWYMLHKQVETQNDVHNSGLVKNTLSEVGLKLVGGVHRISQM